MAGNVYTLGNIVTISTTTKVGGVLTNATSMSLLIKDPTGTTTTVTPSNPSTGNYSYDLTVNYVGLYQYRFVGTGTAAGSQQDYFIVEPLNT